MRTSPHSWSAARLDYALASSREENRAALAVYLPVGYPSRTASRDALLLAARHADVLELGVPHHRPHLDGPVIQQAAAQALAGSDGFQMRDLFATAVELTARTTAALLVMSYWEPIRSYGPRPFARELAAAGGAAVLVPDLPPGSAPPWREAAAEAGLYTIALAPRHASAARLAELGETTTGMLYAPAAPGLTGTRHPLSPYLPRLVRRLRETTGLPVATGIGISSPQQAAHASGFSDAVVVGSAVIRRMEAQPEAPASAAATACRDFAQAVRRAHRAAA
ncbi:tryptophan synthase alpha chain [Streptomyces sp. SAI-208]|uniref:tryptophan synthase subunit alpha n=1 Tax=Streptomyces sp. SAI-208 TaxID=2940550 RepID=UPI002475F571|nr:tryptophan synthase subunit alpha [Streptomyces sp. SAI-208]MDH6604508.1 tryptophan synthase alpha chain [Streptomyces sp. SAI-208]